MSKKAIELPPTNMETAEKRLEEIIANKTITRYVMIFEGENFWCYYPLDGQIKIYPDGVELLHNDGGTKVGTLYFERRRIVIDYDLEREYETQKGKFKE